MSRVSFSLALCVFGIALTVAAPRPQEQQQQQQQQQQGIFQGLNIPGGFQPPNIPGFPGLGGGSGGGGGAPAPTLDINTLTSYNQFLTQYISAFQNQTANIPVIGGGGGSGGGGQTTGS